MLGKKIIHEIFDSFMTPCLVILPDPPRFTIIDANRAYTDVTKTDREELISRGAFEAFPENPANTYGKSVSRARASFERVLNTKELHDMGIQKYDIPVRGTRKFEAKYWRLVNLPILDEKKEVKLILHTARDMTDQVMRKEAEKEKMSTENNLQEINRRLTTILEGITDAFYAVNKEWIITYWNKEAEKLLKRRREDVLGKNIWEVYPPFENASIFRIYSEYHKVMNQTESSSFQVYYEPLKAWFDITAYPGNEGVSVFFKEITERKNKEEEREQLIRELSYHNKDLRQFSYITSHNLRSPITNQESLINLLEQYPIENEEVREILNDIKSSAKVLKETVDDLTEVLIIKDNPSVEKEVIDFSEVFEYVLHQTRYLADKYHPRIFADFKDAPSITFNKSYLESIFLNLFTNSLKFRSPDRQPEISVVTRDREDHVLLEFQDNGIGLDLERHKDHFFGLYQKFHDHTDSKGLGLYLIKSQVEALGGKIDAKSAVDKGLTILIQFKKL